MKPKRNLLLDRPELLVLLVASIKHVLTFMAHDWFAGIDYYSYDVAGLQLVSGQIFDIFPIIFRPPLIPIIKNILYLIFEGHPFALSVFMHLLGIGTVMLTYLLGNRFNKVVGFIVGMLMALNLPISVHFHHISSTTLFLPLLILAVDRFVAWAKKPDVRSLFFLIIITFLCFLARTEAVILIPIFFIFGLFSHFRLKQAMIFLIISLILYNFTCLLYYINLGYWGITCNTGWALFTRVARGVDSQFAITNGAASKKIREYMAGEWPQRMKDVDYRRFQMYSLNLAQQDLGFIEADRLFKQAGIEAIRSAPWKFIKFTSLRVLGQLDLCYTSGLNYKEFPYETDSGHMWGFEKKRMQENQTMFRDWRERIKTITDSPLQWERRVIKARMCRLFGIKSEIPALPVIFSLVPIVKIDEKGEVNITNCGDGVMQERLRSYYGLEIYFNLKYWGWRGYSENALKILKYWDILMPRPKMRINLNRIMWVLWIIGILFNRNRWCSMSLLAMLSFVVLFAICLTVFSDNFGGRFLSYNMVFLWIGSSSGILILWERMLSIKRYLINRHP